MVPKDVAATFSSKRPPVLAHINGVEYRSRLMIYGGQCYLGLRKDLLRRLDVGVGDHVEIELAEDQEERVVVEPPELTAALAEQPSRSCGVPEIAVHPPQ